MTIQLLRVPRIQNHENACRPMLNPNAVFLPIRSEIAPIPNRPKAEAAPRKLSATKEDSLERPMSRAKMTKWTRGRKTKSQVQKNAAVRIQKDRVRIASPTVQVSSLRRASQDSSRSVGG